MKAGTLDRRISIERQTIVGRNDYNEPIVDWSTVAEAWASVQPEREAEGADGGFQYSITDVRIRVRWIPDGVLSTDRIIFEGRVFEIKGTREIGRREGFEIQARYVE